MQRDKVHKRGWHCLLNTEQECFPFPLFFFNYKTLFKIQLISHVSPWALGWQQDVARTGTLLLTEGKSWAGSLRLESSRPFPDWGGPLPTVLSGQKRIALQQHATQPPFDPKIHGYQCQRKSGMEVREIPSGFSLDCVSFSFNLFSEQPIYLV